VVTSWLGRPDDDKRTLLSRVTVPALTVSDLEVNRSFNN
jgi:hypothetical protein